MKSNHFPIWLKWPVVLLGLVIIFLIMTYGRSLLLPLTISALLAMLLQPISSWLQRWKVPRTLAIILSIILLFTVLAAVISVLSLQLVQVVQSLQKANSQIHQVKNEWLAFFQTKFHISPERQMQFFQDVLTRMLKEGGQYATTALGITSSVLTTLGLLPIFVFFLMYYKDMYRNFLHWVCKSSNRHAVDKVIKEVQRVTQSYIVGMMLVIIILTTLNSIGLWIVGLNYALFFAVLASILAIIPYVGIIIGSLPAVIYALLFSGSIYEPIAVIAVFGTVQFFEGHFITPNIVGSRVSINPFMAILALLLGGEIWGVAGMVLFVPLLGILKCIFDQVDALKPYGYLFGNSQNYRYLKNKED